MVAPDGAKTNQILTNTGITLRKTCNMDELKITIQEVIDLRIALNNAERRVKDLMALKEESWQKLYHFDIDSIQKGKEILKTIIERDSLNIERN